jgi:4-amino-4-deoxy-L-arabinose transferase-like glycosyltransferase
MAMIKKADKWNWFDTIVLLVIVFFSLLVWLPSKNLPYHWDSAGFVISSAQKLLDVNFSPLIVPDSDFAHPPFFIATLALSWKIFGQKIIVSHLLMFPFLPIFLTSTYLLAKKLFDKYIALASTILVAVSPFVLAEYGLIYIDLPMASLVLAGICVWFYQKSWISAILLSLAVAIKMPAILAVIGLINYELLCSRKKIKSLLPLLLPFATIFAWLFYHYQNEGWWLISPSRQTNTPSNVSELISSAKYVLEIFFVNQYRLLILGLGLVSTAYLYLEKKSKLVVKNILLPIIVLVISLLFFIIMGEYAMRYGMFLLPFFYILSIYFFKKTGIASTYFWIIIGLIAILSISKWHPKIENTKTYEFRPSEDLSYQDLINIGQESARFLELAFPKAKIYGGFPEIYQLTQPYQGYVSRKLNFSQCPDFMLNKNIQQIIYIHPYSPSQIACRQLLDKVVVKPIRKFESRGKWLELYLVDATESAKLVGK